MPEPVLIPELRFPEYEELWQSSTLGDHARFSKGKGISKADIDEDGPVECIRYGELYTYYKEVIDVVISRTSENPSDLVLSEANDVIIPASGESEIDIATASCVLRSGIALGGDLNIIKSDINGVFLSYYLNNARKTQIARLSQGISVVHLYASQLRGLIITVPSTGEQQKIASFLTAVDKRIRLLQEKKDKLERYKKGVMQKLFSQVIRFKDENGNDFPMWEERRLEDVLIEHKLKNEGNQFVEVFSVSKQKGVINQIEHLGRSYSAESIEHYKLAEPFDIVYTKSPTSDFPFGIIKQNRTGRTGVLSPLYGVFRPLNKWIGFIIHCYFLSWINTYNYLIPLVHKGAKNTMNINNDAFLHGARISLPVAELEQKKIATLMENLDEAIQITQVQIGQSQVFKKALLQKMFV